MNFKNRITNRGFSIIEFQDDCGEECNIQISSSVEPHVWLGMSKPKAIIMWKDAKAIGLDLPKKYPECNEYGWCDYPLPEDVRIFTRMHLTKKQSFKLALKLLKFAFSGRL
jgi:hypothetical protein